MTMIVDCNLLNIESDSKILYRNLIFYFETKKRVQIAAYHLDYMIRLSE